VALGTAGLAFCGWGIQLGALAAATHLDCEDKTAGNNAISLGRRLLATPDEPELKARCSFTYAMDWWVVFYQFAIIATALFHARSEAKFAAVKVRLGMLFAIAIVWVVIQVNAYLPSIVKIQNTLKDAEVKDDNAAVKDSVAGKIYFSGRALGAGYVISAISYFAFIILALGDGDAAPSAKSAAHETA